MDGDEPLYRYDPMRGAALSRTPPPNRNITLRELLGLGRSDIADQEVEARPRYPRLHDDPLAGSPVPPAERDRPILPWLSNLFFEHNGELNEDADEARDDVLERRSKHNVTFPGPDTANFPNSAFTLPKGRAYIETSPVTFFGKSANNSFAAQYNWEFLFRYGLTDDLEFRFFSSGYAVTLSRKPPTSGFSPMVFDFKYHMWDENLDKHIPAAGVEIYVLTPFGSNYFAGGTQPSIALLLDHTLPFDILLEHNFGLTGIEDTFGGAVYEFSYQWALQRQVFKDFAIFTHGFLNSAALPRTPIFQRHIGKGDVRTLLPLDPTSSSPTTSSFHPRSTRLLQLSSSSEAASSGTSRRACRSSGAITWASAGTRRESSPSSGSRSPCERQPGTEDGGAQSADRAVVAGTVHFQLRISGMSTPCLSMYRLCSISLSRSCCLR